MIKRLWLLCILCIGLALILGSCAQPKKVKVALMTKLESGSLIGSSEVDSARMFLNEKGIKDIEIIPFDDGWDPEKVKTAYQEARAQGISIFITSHTSTCALELKKLTDQELETVLVFVTGSTTNQLSNLDDNNIRVVQDVASEQKSIATEISRHNFSQLMIIRDLDNNKYTEPGLAFFKAAYKGDVTLIDISIKNLDMEALRDKMQAVPYDSVYTLIGGNQTVSGSIAQLAWHINPNINVFFTPWNNASTVVETAGEAIDVCVMANHYPLKDNQPGVKAYFDQFDKVYGYIPTYNSLHVYRALSVLSEAVAAGNSDPKTIKAFAIKQADFDTDFGPLSFNASGDVEMPLYFIDQVKKAFE